MKKVINKNPFPQRIGKFQYLKTIEEFSAESAFKFACYLDDTGREYICKMWTGNKNELKYKWIKNEIESYLLLQSAVNKRKNLGSKYSKLFIPKIHITLEDSNSIMFIMDKVKGQHLSKRPVDEILSSYELIYDYFGEVSETIDPNKTNLVKRNPIHYFLLFHYYFAVTILKYPRLLPLLLSVLPTVYKGFFSFHSEKENNNHLVLRDLASENNILATKNTISVIDFESMVITNRLVQIANYILIESANSALLKKLFKSPIFLSIKKDIKKTEILKALLIYGAIVNITASFRKNKQELIESAQSIFALSKTI